MQAVSSSSDTRFFLDLNERTKMSGVLIALFLGKKTSFKSSADSKRALLISQLSTCCLLICGAYLSIDLVLGSPTGRLLYLALVVIAIVTLAINRFGFHKTAKITYLIGANIVLFYALEREHYATGTFIFFITLMLAAFALFGYEDKYSAIGISVLSAGLCIVSFQFDFSFIQKVQFPPGRVEMNFVINFTMASMVTIVIVVFMLDLNAKSEAVLKSISEELISNKDRFELAVRGSSAGIWDWDIEKHTLFVSPQFALMLGFATIHVAYINPDIIPELMHPDDFSLYRHAISAHLNYKKPFSIEIRLRKIDGSYLWVLYTGQAQWNANGSAVRMVGTILDIEIRRRSFQKIEEQNRLLEKTNEELDLFVYSASHDLKAPLSSVLGLISIAELSNDREELQQCFTRMRTSISTLNGFIKNITDYSKNTRLEVMYEQFALLTLMEECVETFKGHDARSQIRIYNQIPPSLNLYCDRDRLKTVLCNLLANAFCYHNLEQDKPAIFLTAEIQNQFVKISVIDNGIGIHEAHLDKIFNMFFRGSERSVGAGLGLYIAKETATKLEGSISVVSKLNEGSTFCVNIPIGT